MGSEEQAMVILGMRRYRVERDWARFPEGTSRGLVSQIAVGTDGRVFVFRRGATPVAVFSVEGDFECGWGSEFILDPHGIYIDRDNRVLLVDRDAHQVFICDANGERLSAIGKRHSPEFQAPFNHPTDAAVARDGEIYIADGYGNSCVHRFAANGNHIATWGSPGAGDGEFSTPHAVWVDRSDRVLVADRENNRVQVFERDGTYITQWCDFFHPMDLFEDSAGNMYVTDQIPRLSLVSPNGELLGRCRPVWNVPHGISGNAQGDIFLTEMNPSSIVKLTLQ